MLGRILPEWDISLAGGQATFIDDIDYAAQKVKQRLQFLKGEWFADTNLGFPLLQEVCVKNPDLTAVRGLYRKHILAVPGIVRVAKLDLSFDPASRKLSGSFVAIYRDGTAISDSL